MDQNTKHSFTLNSKVLVTTKEKPLASEVLEMGVEAGVLRGRAEDFLLFGVKEGKGFKVGETVDLNMYDELRAAKVPPITFGFPFEVNDFEIASPHQVVRPADIVAMAVEWEALRTAPQSYRVWGKDTRRDYTAAEEIDLEKERTFVVTSAS